MSNIFLKNEFASIFGSLTESNIELPKYINIIDNANNTQMTEQDGGYSTSEMPVNKLLNLIGTNAENKKQEKISASSKYPSKENFSTTSSDFASIRHQRGGAFSNTSSDFASIRQQRGGAFSTTSDYASIHQQHGGAYSETSSDIAFMHQKGGNYSESNNGALENDFSKLVSMLTSESNSSGTQTEVLENRLSQLLTQHGGSSKTNFNDIKRFFVDLKSQGVDVNIKLNDKTMTEFFDLSRNTTTEIGNYDMTGGARGMNAGFQAFLDFKKYIANKLKVSNNPKVGKVAGMIQQEMKKKYSNLSAVDIAEKGKEHFDNNKSKYESEYKKLLK
jgi:hypothetical protein